MRIRIVGVTTSVSLGGNCLLMAFSASAPLPRTLSEQKDMRYAFGPPHPEKPSYELLGELLLKHHQLREAEAAFKEALSRAPGHTESLADLLRASTAAIDAPTLQAP
jgi:uncharacterized protein HemY